MYIWDVLCSIIVRRHRFIPQAYITRKSCAIARRGCGVYQALLCSLGVVYVADEGGSTIVTTSRSESHPRAATSGARLSNRLDRPVLLSSRAFNTLQKNPNCSDIHPMLASPHPATRRPTHRVWAIRASYSPAALPRTTDDTDNVALTEREERPRGM